jgi:uncharacterized membrane protein
LHGAGERTNVTFWIVDWLRAFALTVLIELVIALPWLRRAEPRVGRRLAGIVLANLATHPLVWFLFPGLLVPYGARIALSELWAFLGETCVYKFVWPTLPLQRAALVSLVANGTSFGIGLLLFRR